MPTIDRPTDDRLMLGKEVRQFFGGISETSLWRKVKAGKIPPPIKIAANVNGWWRSEIVASVDALPRGVSSGPSPRSRLDSTVTPAAKA